MTNRDLEILYSDELLDEYQGVINRPKFQKIISSAQVSRFLNLIVPRLKKVKISSPVLMSRDPKDNYLLSMSIDSDADFLVTGDDDLLVLEQIGRTRIIRMAEFLTSELSNDVS